MTPKLLTICIPTFNRANMTIALISSLPVRFNVEYIVVDDGSIDEEYIKLETFISNSNRLDCQLCRKQENGGKFSALKEGVRLAKGEYFMDLDSDDYLLDRHIDAILGALKNEGDCGEKLIGIIGLCEGGNEEVIGDSFPVDVTYASIPHLRFDLKVKGDKKEIVKTEVLKLIDVQLFPGEKRMPTGVHWLSLKNEKLKLVHSVFCKKRYLKDGLTKNILSSRVNSAFSSRFYYELAVLLYGDSYLSRTSFLKAIVNYYRFSFHGAKPFFKSKIFRKIGLNNILIVAALILYLVDSLVLLYKKD